MIIQKSFSPPVTNRLAISENFSLYPSYEKTSSALVYFGIAGTNPFFPNFIKNKKRGPKMNRNLSKRAATHLGFIHQSKKPQTENSAIVVSRNFVRRLRRFERSTASKKGDEAPKPTLFGNYSKISVFKHFKFFKTRSTKPVPRLTNNSLNTSRRVQDWGYSFPNNTFKTSITKAMSIRRGTPVHLLFIPAFSFSRFGIDLESVQIIARRKSELGSGINLESRPTSAIFLRHISDEIRGRFQYVAIQIPDLLRVSFIAIYFKNPALLAQLFALTLGALPRNRKETQFLRFLLKIIKVFAAQRSERLGVRIRFKGRVNRWRRTKHVTGEKGLIPLYTYSARVEIGEAQAITRKGTLGIRIWLAYKNIFAETYRRTFIAYTVANNRKRILENVSSNTPLFSKSQPSCIPKNIWKQK